MVSRRAVLKGIVLSAVGGAAGTAAYGIAYERHEIQLTRATLSMSGLPRALDGLRIGLITDLHHSATVPAEDVTRAVELLRAEQPEMIVLGGDYVSFGDRAFAEPAAELLSPLQARHGVFAILGNHDDERDMSRALTRRGVTMLNDARTRLRIQGEQLDVAGVRFWTRRGVDVARVLRGSAPATLLLAHDPRRLTEAAALNVPGVLSGHTHGGQIVLPGVGALARRRFPVLSGLGSLARTSIFVSRGVGTVYVPIRVNCPPEVAIVTLRAAVL